MDSSLGDGPGSRLSDGSSSGGARGRLCYGRLRYGLRVRQLNGPERRSGRDPLGSRGGRLVATLRARRRSPDGRGFLQPLPAGPHLLWGEAQVLGRHPSRGHAHGQGIAVGDVVFVQALDAGPGIEALYGVARVGGTHPYNRPLDARGLSAMAGGGPGGAGRMIGAGGLYHVAHPLGAFGTLRVVLARVRLIAGRAVPVATRGAGFLRTPVGREGGALRPAQLRILRAAPRGGGRVGLAPGLDLRRPGVRGGAGAVRLSLLLVLAAG